MTAEQRANEIAVQFRNRHYIISPDEFEWLCREAEAQIRGAIHDQREACAEAVNSIDRNTWSRSEVYRVVMNAEVEPL